MPIAHKHALSLGSMRTTFLHFLCYLFHLQSPAVTYCHLGDSVEPTKSHAQELAYGLLAYRLSGLQAYRPPDKKKPRVKTTSMTPAKNMSTILPILVLTM